MSVFIILLLCSINVCRLCLIALSFSLFLVICILLIVFIIRVLIFVDVRVWIFHNCINLPDNFVNAIIKLFLNFSGFVYFIDPLGLEFQFVVVPWYIFFSFTLFRSVFSSIFSFYNGFDIFDIFYGILLFANLNLIYNLLIWFGVG